MALAQEFQKIVWKDDEGIEYESRLDAAKASARQRIGNIFQREGGEEEWRAREYADMIIKNRRAIDEILIDLYSEEQRP